MTPATTVADVVGATIAAQGVHDAFGVVGSGNLVATNALIAGGTRVHHARHECAAVCMADGYARVSGCVGVATVHQGPGLTNTMTGLAEAAKSRTPLVVLAGETPAAALTSNFRIDQHDLVESVGAIADRVFSAESAAADAARAYHRALIERRPVVLMMPIDIQAAPAPAHADADARARPRALELEPPAPPPQAIDAAVQILDRAQKPAILAGRGAVLADAGPALEALGAKTGALLATSAPAHGLFAGLPYALGISGGFASPLAAELLPQADAVLIVGASANHWTTRHGAMIGSQAKVIQVDTDPRAIGRHRPTDAAILGDARHAAQALEASAQPKQGFRTTETAATIAQRHWRAEPYADATTEEWIDPRTLTIALDRLLPHARQVAVDSGHFLGYPSQYLDVPDARSWVFPNGFQAVGLGLACAIGAAVALPDRTTVAAIGDGGAFMALAELETAARLKLDNLLVLIYNDAAYGAEVHHFAPLGHDVGLVRFPDADLAGIAQAAGAHGATVRSPSQLEEAVTNWLAEPHFRPLVIDAKVNPAICAEWLEEAFRAG